MKLTIYLVVLQFSCYQATITYRDFSTDFRAAIELYLKSVTACQKIPAVSVAVLKFSPGSTATETVELSYKRAAGVTSFGSKTQATKQTPFCITSQTQTFTALLVAKAYEAGLLQWDSRVAKIYGDVLFKSQFFNDQMTLRDLLSQRSGFPAYKNFQAAGGNWKTRNDLKNFFLRLKVKESEFRDRYTENDLMFGLAAILVEAVSKQTYEDVLKSEILTPMGLVDYQFLNESATGETIALPHLFNSKEEPIPVESKYLQMITAMGSSNSLCLSTNDIVKWLRFLLNAGKLEDNSQLVGSSTLKEMFSSSTIVKPPQFYQTTDDAITSNIFIQDKYGLSWVSGIYQGHETLTNAGSLLGYNSATWVFPKAKIAIFVGLTGSKAQSHPVATYIASFIASNVLSLTPPMHNSNFICALTDKSSEVTNNDFNESKPECLCPNLDSSVISRIAGEYIHEALGSVLISGTDNQTATTVTFGQFGKATLCQWPDNLGIFWLKFQDFLALQVKAECPVTTALPFFNFLQFPDYNATQTAATLRFDFLQNTDPPLFLRKLVGSSTTAKFGKTNSANTYMHSAMYHLMSATFIALAFHFHSALEL